MHGLLDAGRATWNGGDEPLALVVSAEETILRFACLHEKQQVALMVSRILELPAEAEAGDAADALAVALCGAQLSATPATLAAASRMRGRASRRSAS